MKLWTSRYQNKGLVSHPAVKVGATVYPPRWKVAYPVKRFTLIAPTGALFHLNDEAEFRVAYFERLDQIGVDTIRAALRQLTDGRDAVLLCYEDVTETWCHRRCFADWWEERTGEKVEELPVLPVVEGEHQSLAKQLTLW